MIVRLGWPSSEFSKTIDFASALARFKTVGPGFSHATSDGVKCRRWNLIPPGSSTTVNNSSTSVLSFSSSWNVPIITPAWGAVQPCCATRGPQEPCHLPASHAKSASATLGAGAVFETSSDADVAAPPAAEANADCEPAPVGCWASVAAGIVASKSDASDANRIVWRMVMRTRGWVRIADFPFIYINTQPGNRRARLNNRDWRPGTGRGGKL